MIFMNQDLLEKCVNMWMERNQQEMEQEGKQKVLMMRDTTVIQDCLQQSEINK